MVGQPVEQRPGEALGAEDLGMAAYGVPEADVARVLDIDAKTLRKHYRDELDTGHIKANSKIAESLFRKATGDGREAVIAAIFWLKTRAHWKETVVQEAEVRHSYVIRTPPPVASVSEWLQRHAPPEIEHSPAPRLCDGA